ncbi:MAG: heme lyase CcmF/NrfE family subunit [Bacillota bacterium]
MRLPSPPVDGQGLNPLLQNPGMIIHPPTQYLGYAGFAVPFAFAMAALILRRPDDLWLRITRRWTLVTWLFLSIGMIFGGQWAYVELGWGGYWGWDPVENASLMPWLTGTAFLHSVMIQERRGMLKVWNVALIVVTFALTLFGTFLTRSGVLASVHAFGDSALGAYFIGFVAVVVFASVWLILRRLPLLKEEGLLSKESSFLANNLVLIGGAFTVFWGTIFPLLSEAFTGNKVSVSAPYYNRVMVPIGIVLVALVGVCPFRRRSDGRVVLDRVGSTPGSRDGRRRKGRTAPQPFDPRRPRQRHALATVHGAAGPLGAPRDNHHPRPHRRRAGRGRQGRHWSAAAPARAGRSDAARLASRPVGGGDCRPRPPVRAGTGGRDRSPRHAVGSKAGTDGPRGQGER